MIPTTAAYDAALDQAEQFPAIRVLADWDRDGFALHGTNRVIDPSFPSGADGWGAVPGYASPLVFRSSPLQLLWDTTAPVGGLGLRALAGPFAPGKTYRCELTVRVSVGGIAVQWGDLAPGGALVSSTITGADQRLVVDVTATAETVIGIRTAAGSPTGSVDISLPLVAGPDDLDDLSEMVTSVEVTQAITTDLPESTRLVAGESTASAVITLTGDPDDAARDALTLWSPYNPARPTAGKQRRGLPIRVELGYETADGPQTLPVLVGRARDPRQDGADGDMTIDVLDGSGAGVVRVDFPMMIANETGPAFFTQRPGLRSQVFIDLIARRLGYYATPPMRDACILSVPLHGTLYAENQTATAGLNQGWHQRVNPDGSIEDVGVPVPFTQGRYALAPTPERDHFYTGVYVFDDGPGLPSQQAGGHYYHESWICVPDKHNRTAEPDVLQWISDSGGLWGLQLRLDVDGAGLGQLTARVIRNGTTATTMTPAVGEDLTPGWHYVAIYIEHPTNTAMATVWNVDGAEEIGGASGITSAAGSPPMNQYVIQSFAPAEAIQVTSEVFGPTFDPFIPSWNDTFTPTAILEPGISELTATPIPRTDDARRTLQDIVAAEYGVLLHRTVGTRTDVLTFWDANHWRNTVEANTVVRTITATEKILALQVSEPNDAVRNVIRVPVQPLHLHPTGIIWQIGPDRGEKVPARGRLELWADFGDFLAYKIPGTGSVIPNGGPTTANGYRAARQENGTGGAVSNLVMTVTPFAASAKITVTNPNNFPAWLVSPTGAGFPTESDGKGALALVGRKVSRRPPGLDTGTVDPNATADYTVEVRSESSIAAHDGIEHVLPIPESPWRQAGTSAETIGKILRRALAHPAPQITDLEIVADPSLQPGDRVQIADPEGTRLDDPFWVVGNRLAFDPEFASQRVTLRGVARPGQWLLGVPGRTELGVTTTL